MSKQSEWARLGYHLWKARKIRGLSQAQVARLSSIDRTTIARIEKGERLPSLDQLLALTKGLSVSIQWFRTGNHALGKQLPDLACELHHLGIVDLLISDATAPAAFRPKEEVVALVLAGSTPDPRIVEALPAVLAWNLWNHRLLRAYAISDCRRTLARLGWLADVVVTIHRNWGFPGGCRDLNVLDYLATRVKPSKLPDSMGYADSTGKLPPVSKRWNITLGIRLQEFRERARTLWELRGGARTTLATVGDEDEG